MGGRLPSRNGLSAKSGGDIISHSLPLPTKNNHRCDFQLAEYFLPCELIRFLAHTWNFFSQTLSYIDTWYLVLLESTSSLVYLSGFIVLITIRHVFFVTFSDLENSDLIDMVADMFWSWLLSTRTLLWRKRSRSGTSTVRKATDVFTAGTYFHLDAWNAYFWCWERLSEMGEVVGVYFQVKSTYS